MSFILRVGASNLPVATDTITVYEAGTSNVVSGLTDLSGSPLSNPLTVPSSGQYGFEPPSSDKVDIYWNQQSSYIVQNVNVRDITLDLSDMAYKSSRTTCKNISNAYTGTPSTISAGMVCCIVPDEDGDGSQCGIVLPLTDFVEIQSFGIALETITDTSTGAVEHGEGLVITGLSGLIAGEWYTAETDGSLTVVSEASPEVLDAVAWKIAGQALSSTTFQFKKYVKRIGYSDLEMNDNAISGLKTASFNSLVSNVTASGACTINLASGQMQKITLSDDTAITFSNLTKGRWTLFIYQSGDNDHAVTFTQSINFPGGTAYTATTGSGAVDILTIIYDGTSLYAAAALDFSVPS